MVVIFSGCWANRRTLNEAPGERGADEISVINSIGGGDTDMAG